MNALLAVCGVLSGFFALSGILSGLLVVVVGGRAAPVGRRFGFMVALWWVPALAAAAGLLAADPATTLLGLALFAGGGLALLLGGDLGAAPTRQQRR